MSVKQLLSGFAEMASRADVFGGTHGNLSAREGVFSMLIKPSGVPFREIREPCRALFDAKGEILQVIGGLNPSVDAPHHAKIYAKNPGIQAICHSHSKYVVAHAIGGYDIPCLSTEQADVFGGGIDCLTYSDFNSWGDQVANLQQANSAVLLERHGALTFSAVSPLDAVKLACRLEDVAEKNFLAEQLHRHPIWPMDQKEVMKWRVRYVEGYGQKK